MAHIKAGPGLVRWHTASEQQLPAGATVDGSSRTLPVLLSTCYKGYVVSWKNCEQPIVYREGPGSALVACHQLLGAFVKWY